jgi:hypothetical protein
MRVPWWSAASPDEAARKLYSQAQSIETTAYGRRYRNATLYRLVTGEDVPLMFGYWMSPRVGPAIGTLAATSYVEPAVNLVASAVEVFENRIGTLRPFVQVLPQGGDFKTRQACKKRELFLDALFDEERLYETTRLVFRDAATWGTGFVKVSTHPTQDRIVIERVLDDEILVDEIAAMQGAPAALIQRRYMTKEELFELYGDDEDAARAIAQAPVAFSGSFWATQSTTQMVAVLEGYKLPGADGTPGRRLLALPNKALDDIEWKRKRFPFAKLRWTPQSLGFRGQSCAMALLPYQVEINRHVDLIHENQLHFGPNRWLVEGNSKVRTEQLGARPGAVTRYVGAKPDPITPNPNSPEMYTSLQNWIDRGYMRVGLNQQAASGLKQPGITSGKALRTMLQIEDARNKALQIALEGLVKDIGELAVEEADDTRPMVIIPGIDGGPMKWDDVGKAKGAVSVFPVSALPNEPAGRQQQIADWYADGTIDRRTYFRLQQMPDLQAYAVIATAADDLIESTLDQIVETEKYVPPEPYDDLGAAFKACQARYWLEKRLKASRKVLRLLQTWMSAVAELMADPSGQMMQPPAQGPAPGIAPPAGAAPAPPPPQATPTIAPPVQLPAAA